MRKKHNRDICLRQQWASKANSSLTSCKGPMPSLTQATHTKYRRGHKLLPGHGAAARPLCLSNFPKVLQRDCHHCHHSGRPRAGATHPNPNGPLQPGSRRTWACWVPPWTTWTRAPTKSSYLLWRHGTMMWLPIINNILRTQLWQCPGPAGSATTYQAADRATASELLSLGEASARRRHHVAAKSQHLDLQRRTSPISCRVGTPLVAIVGIV